MKKYKKLLINIMVIFIILFNLFIPNAYAGPLQDIMNRAEGFVNNGENGGNVINNDALKEGSNTLYNVLLVIGIAVAFIWGIVLGIQFITGSLGEKADVKKNLIVYLVGCVIIFGAFGIWKLLLQLLEPLE
ncbi:MAG: hypothetical protein ACLRTR_08620 [Clostridia bacterium]|jgi:hypothetical protein|nr:MAG: hypothetical protein BHW09_04200 [Clostridium sp. CAG:245_30_32]CDA59548.1 unknown [Clostridium sp. CAG:245]